MVIKLRIFVLTRGKYYFYLWESNYNLVNIRKIGIVLIRIAIAMVKHYY